MERQTVARQLALPLDNPVLEGLEETVERDQAVSILAQLLVEAVGMGDEEEHEQA